MHNFHQTLLDRVPLYADWHKHPWHKVAHWFVFTTVALALSSGMLGDVNQLALNSSNHAAAAVNLAALSAEKPSVELPALEPAQDHILIKFKSTAVGWTRQDIFRRYSLSERSEIPRIGVKIVNIGANDTPEEVVQRLLVNEKAAVEFAEVDAAVPPSLVSNDPSFNEQWYLTNIGIARAWNIATGTSPTVIAVLDTGTDCTHPDLAAGCVPGWNLYGNNADVSDVLGHGTAVSGAAAAVSNNGIGVASLNWGARLMPLRISDDAGYGYGSTAASGIVYAADHGAKVANVSYRMTDSRAVSAAAKYLQSKGGLVVMSAGNQGSFDNTADDPNILLVNATDPGDVIASWSNNGNNIDLSAPGVGIYTTAKGGGYHLWSGTSLSAPLVAGLAALVISTNPSLTAVQVQDIIKRSADDLGSKGWDTQYGWGRINAYGAISLACSYPGAKCASSDTESPSIPQNPGATAPDSTAVNFSWNSSADNVKVTGYTVYRNDVDIADTTDSFYKDTAVVPGYSYYYYVKAFDLAGNLSSPSTSVSITVPSTTSSTDSEAPSIPASFTGTIATSADPQTVNLSWNESTDNKEVAGYYIYRNYIRVGSSATRSYVDSTAAAGGVYSYYVKAFDAAGNISQPSSSINIKVPALPDATAPSAPTNLTAGARGGKINLSWGSSKDDVAVKGYNIYRNGALVATTTALAYTDLVVNAGSSYVYYVAAYDAVGNLSSPSNTVSITVPESSSGNVSLVSFQVSRKSATTATITWVTDRPSSGSVSYGSDNGLGSSISDPSSATSHSVTITGLSSSSKYYYQVSAVSEGGVTVKSQISTFKTASK